MVHFLLFGLRGDTNQPVAVATGRLVPLVVVGWIMDAVPPPALVLLLSRRVAFAPLPSPNLRRRV